MSTHYVYWIHNITMTDPTLHGYIGVTNNTKRRWTNHFSKLKHGAHENQHFQRAFDLDDELVVDVLFEGTEVECYTKERELRPARSIGWNINEGGTRPPAKPGNQHAKGNKGPAKQVVSPDGLVFESRKAAATHYNVDVTTIHNWLKTPNKPWIKGVSPLRKESSRRASEISRERTCRPIMTPRGKFDSVKSASLAFGVVHGTVNYWLKTRPEEFFYLIKSDVSA